MTKKIALVTGGTGGIGSSICESLYDAGFTVVAGYCNGGKNEKAKTWQANQLNQGRNMHIAYVDVSDWDACQRTVLDIEETVGPIEILVNNAGITRDGGFKKMTKDRWDDVINTNLTGTFAITRMVINTMLEKKFGRIINISSINGQKGQFGQVNYSAAKAGLHGFTKALALEVASKGITVNTISPGYIATDMVMAVDESIRDQIISEIPVKRLGRPEEIARIVAFLADEDSGFITGSNISANGGHHMY